MMKLRVVLSSTALRQLENAFTWWSENRSAEQAARWYDGIRAAIESIGDRPVRYSLAWEDRFSKDEVRELLFGLGRRPTHRALFVVHSESIYVFAIRHVAQEPLGPDDLDFLTEE